ncbi:FliR [Pantoea ananatis LMG 20103]|uniref:Flagellar biosynthetic protein FliR n=1 Tax=Pantoea ananatis (strain LMG 20103) TaxID=706191 RepID=D4GH27_PANAM|nr:flagellar biosynthetic protein FliR [Pantoea ananatis]ADD77474.1 FliR [Pantoea ananatis LMG 20103]
MITLDSSQLVHWVSQFFWPLVRILALLATAPVLSEKAVSKRVKIGLAAMITWILIPNLPPVNVTLFSPAGFMLLIQQMLIGIAIGFTMQFAFAAVRTAGELIGLQMGLSFATFFDPASRLNMPVLARFLDMLAMLFIFDFQRSPVAYFPAVGQFSYVAYRRRASSGKCLYGFGEIRQHDFLNGMMLALPLIVLLLTINMVLGLLNRLSPQLSIFAIGFPITLSVGILTISLLMPLLAPFCEHLFGEIFDLLAQFLTELSPV